MAVYAIGDVQGCYDELLLLLEKLQFDPATDNVWFTGDLVNRGPQSLAVMRFVMGLGDSAVTVLGNHDLHLLAVAAGVRCSRPGDTFDDILAAPDREDLLAWLRCRPLLHRDVTLGFVMIHAGLPPQWDIEMARACAKEVEVVLSSNNYDQLIRQMYGNEPHTWEDTLQGWERLRFIINCFTRLRYCDRGGRLALDEKGPPGSQTAGLLPWFELWDKDRYGMKVLFGHWSTLGNVRLPGFFALDSGCVWGGALTALTLTGDHVMMSVPCQGACLPGEV